MSNHASTTLPLPVGVEVPQSFVDVLYLTSRDQIPSEVRRLFRQKSVSYTVLPLDKFPRIMHRLDRIGTVIVDMEGLESSQQQKLARIIESLEMSNVGVILLSRRVKKTSVRSFALAGPEVRSFALTTTLDAVATGRLWAQISVNLAYRKKSSPVAAANAAARTRPRDGNGNALTEQLTMTEALIDSLAEELRMAGLLQRDFLPAQLPDTEQLQWGVSFLPAEWVSGDIYDVTRVDEQHIGFYVADAVGHAMPAALLTIFIKQAMILRETVGNNYRIFSPAEVVMTLNQRMAAQKLSGYQFATCCYCLLNTKTLQLTFSRAGHPYPILLRGGEPPQLLEAGGPLLGIFEQSQYSQQTLQLKPGDKLLLYSDGAEPFIGSCDDLTGFGFIEEFSEIKALPIPEMLSKFSVIAQSMKVAPYEIDDVTVLGLEVKRI